MGAPRHRPKSPSGALPLFTVDAFTERAFSGNPAAVCLARHPLPDRILKSIAREMNLSETAFVRSKAGGKIGPGTTAFGLRWFTPAVEVELCGHATLASATVLFREVGVRAKEISFMTLSGELRAAREKERIRLDFPVDPPEPLGSPADVLEALGVSAPVAVCRGHRSRNLLVHVRNEAEVRAVAPRFDDLRRAGKGADLHGFVVTAPGRRPYDFVSRYFAPGAGVNEDPVTGSSHTLLGPYWAEITGKREFRALQVSGRGGSMTVRVRDDARVDLVGSAVVVSRGELLPG